MHVMKKNHSVYKHLSHLRTQSDADSGGGGDLLLFCDAGNA